MRILKYNGRLVEEVGSVKNEKVVFLRYLEEKDKDKCPHCNKTLDNTIDIVEGCLNWKEMIEGVETIKNEDNFGNKDNGYCGKINC